MLRIAGQKTALRKMWQTSSILRKKTRTTRISAKSYVNHMQTSYFFHRIGLWENLQESPIFDGKSMVSCRFSLKPIQWFLVTSTYPRFFWVTDPTFLRYFRVVRRRMISLLCSCGRRSEPSLSHGRLNLAGELEGYTMVYLVSININFWDSKPWESKLYHISYHIYLSIYLSIYLYIYIYEWYDIPCARHGELGKSVGRCGHSFNKKLQRQSCPTPRLVWVSVMKHDIKLYGKTIGKP